MRITFLTPSDSLTGGTRVVATYARLLQGRGHEVLVVSNAPDRPTWRERARALRRGSLGLTRSGGLVGEGHIALSGVPHRVLERPRPIVAHDLPDADIVIATWWETAEWMHRLPASKGRPIHLVQGYEIWTGGDVRDRVHAALRLPNRKIAISNALARDIESELGDLGMVVVPNAVDLDQFDAPPRHRGVPPTVGYVYAATPIKGADLCARACELARRRIPELRVVAFGADAPSADFPLPAGTRFFRRPPQQELPSIYARCDAWLFGSRLDSFGLPILEAMACRTPVIGVPTGAAPDLLADGAGMLVPPESPESMADVIAALCAGPEATWQLISQRAHDRAHGYSWQDATTRLLTVLSEDAVVGTAAEHRQADPPVRNVRKAAPSVSPAGA